MRFADLTTLRVGGEPRELVSASTPDELVDVARGVWAEGGDWFVLGGGSNVVAGDDPFDGTVIRVVSRGIHRVRAEGRVRLRVQAGENWDELVAHAVGNGWAGIEALSGIPGTVGAAPIQNIGAYGQELASSLAAVEFLDYGTGQRERMPAGELGLGYRTSELKRGRRGVVVAAEFDLTETDDGLSEPIAYDQLATALNVDVGVRVPLTDVRRAVLELRAAKGMLLDPADPDSVSAGSFFTNPIVGENFARGLPAGAPRWRVRAEPEARAVPLGEEPAPPPSFDEQRVKLSAAWLIERAGIRRGFSLPGSRAAISGKHTLALVNTGGATAGDILELARFVQTRVLSEFGVVLTPEPVLLNVGG